MAKKTEAEQKEQAKFEKNYADKSSVTDRAWDLVITMIQAAKSNRTAKEYEWLEDYTLWSCQLTQSQMYLGRANLFVPELNNQIEISVGRMQSAIFPNDNYLKCVPMQGTQDKTAADIQAAVYYQLQYKNNLPAISERFQRQKTMFGTSPLKVRYLDEKMTVFAKDKNGRVKAQEIPKWKGVKIDVCDLFHWYSYPETVPFEEASIIFEEAFIDKEDLKASGLYMNLDDVEEIHADYSTMGWIDTLRLEVTNISSTAAQRPKAVLVTECWLDFDIEPGKRVPCVVTLANLNTVIRVQRNPFWHQRPPYLVGKYLCEATNPFYGHSLPERLRSLQYQMNDLANQTMDSLTYALNPIAIIDPGYGADPNGFKVQPGAKWWANPQAVQMAAFPDVSGSGFRGMQDVRGMIQQFSDNSPSVAPQLSGKVRSATQSASVSAAVSQNLKNLIRQDEFNVYEPLAKMTHLLLTQFMDENYQIQIQGPDKGEWITKNISPEDIIGDVKFVWEGAGAQEKTAVRSQQLMGFLNLCLQYNSMSPGSVDLDALYQRVAAEAFDIYNLSDYFKSAKEKKTVDPKVENIALNEQQEVVVNLGDQFEVHMEVHGEGLKAAKDNETKIAYLKHMERHKQQKDALDKLRQQQAELAALQANEGSQPQPGRGPGNPNQQAIPASDSAVMQGMRGTEPNM